MLFNAHLSKGNLYFIYFLKQVGAYVPIIQYSRWTVLEYENETRKNLMLLYVLSINKMGGKYHSVGPIQKSNFKIVDSGKIDIPNTQILVHDSLLSWLGTDSSIQSGGVKLDLWVQTFHLSEIKKSTKKCNTCLTFLYVSNESKYNKHK